MIKWWLYDEDADIETEIEIDYDETDATNIIAVDPMDQDVTHLIPDSDWPRIIKELMDSYTSHDGPPL
jgi:hypothetical protein